jgi:hypothetical protein
MDAVHQIVNAFLNLVVGLLDLVLTGLGALEAWLRVQLTAMGVSGEIQPIILIVVAVLFLILALRVMGGIIRLVVLVFLVLLILHILMPAWHA